MHDETKIFMNHKYLPLLLICISFLVSCDFLQNELRTQADPASVPGSWKVERFEEGAQNETSSFNQIRFRFESDGTFLVLRSGTEIARGIWELSDRNRELIIDVPPFRNEELAARTFGDDIYEIHDDWNVLEFSDNRMRIRDEDEEFILVRE